MKLNNFILFFVILFLILGTLTVSKKSLEILESKRYFYTYPTGTIGNTNSSNHQLMSANILKDKALPILNITKDDFLETRKNQLLKLFSDFGFYFLVIFVIFFTSIYFFVKKNDLYLALLFFCLSSLLLSNFVILVFESYFFFFYFFFIFLGFLILNLGFRLKGKDNPIRWLIPELCFSLVFSYLGYSDGNSHESFERLTQICIGFLAFAILVCILVLAYDLIKYNNAKKVIFYKSFLALYLAFLFLLPYTSFYFQWFAFFPQLYYIILASLFISPFLFIVGTYRYTNIPEQFYFSSSIVGVSLLGFYLIIYSMFFLFLEYIQLYFIIQVMSPIYLFFIFITVYPIVNIKQKIKEWVRKYTFDKSTKLNKSLEEITELISNPISLRRTMRVVVKKITEALDIETLIIMVSSEKFPSLEFKQINLLKIIPNSEVWNYLKNEKDVTITSSLQFGSGLRLSVYKFLTNLKIQLAFPMYGFDEDNKIDAFFLVGEKKRATSFSLAEIRFIQECARLTDLIIHNYQLLLDDIQKKKMERNLKAASIIEETISAYKTFNEPIAGTEVNFFTIPAVEISGDYLDLIKLNEKEVAIFLGDVSGHGLGSGYLVNAIKAMIRNQVQIGLSLGEILENINHFLIERYGGSEFMTLIAGKYDSSLGSFEFINAGHMAPMILKESGKLEFAKGSNRILGVLKAKYNLHNLILEKGDRLILYSDGITETFSVSDEIYGESRFRDFIVKTNGLNASEVISKLKLELDNFRSSNSPLDDTSLIYLKRL